MLCKQIPGIRGERQGGVLEGFDLFFGEFSVKFPDECSVKKGKPRAVSAKIWDLSSWEKHRGFHKESESEVKNAKFQAPEGKKYEKHKLR